MSKCKTAARTLALITGLLAIIPVARGLPLAFDAAYYSGLPFPELAPLLSVYLAVALTPVALFTVSARPRFWPVALIALGWAIAGTLLLAPHGFHAYF